MQIKANIKRLTRFVFAASFFLSVLLIQTGLASATQMPAISPNGGEYTSSLTVTIGNIDSGDTAYYTIDGSDPTTNSAAIEYTTPFTVSQSEIVRSAIEDSSGNWSGVANAIFIIGNTSSSSVDTPTISPNGGEFTSSQTVTIGNIDSGDTAYYTTDGSNPTTNSAAIEYSGSFTVSQSGTILASVKDSTGDWSKVAGARFDIDNQPSISDNNNVSELEQELLRAINSGQIGEVRQILGEIEQLYNQNNNNSNSNNIGNTWNNGSGSWNQGLNSHGNSRGNVKNNRHDRMPMFWQLW